MAPPPAIKVTGLTKDRVSSFLRRRTRVLENLDLTVYQGETFGLIGPNGAGKTTALKVILGLLRADRGEIEVLGHGPGDPRALSRIGFLPENPYFYSHLTGREFLEFIGELFGIAGSLRRKRAGELLERVQLKESADEPMRKYSKGMLQRLGIAQSLINDPELVFWDEPMSGLDPIGRRNVREILLSLKEAGKTVFFNSHLLPDVSEVCDRVAVMNRGRLIALDEVGNITGERGYLDLEDYFLKTVSLDKEPEKSAEKPGGRNGGD